MKITVTQTNYYNGPYARTKIIASTELGTITLKDEEDYDEEADYGPETTETETKEFADVEKIYNAGYDTTAEIGAILPASYRIEKEQRLAGEKNAALSAGKKSFISKVDGSPWLYRHRKRTWERVSWETYFINDGEI